MAETSKRVVIGYIEPDIRIATEENCFIIERLRKKKDNQERVWVGKHYFSTFGDLLRYYARIYLQRENNGRKTEDLTLLHLLDSVTALATKIDEVNKRLQEGWAAHCNYYDSPKEKP